MLTKYIHRLSQNNSACICQQIIISLNIVAADGLVLQRACAGVARARPAVPLGLWSITSSLRGNLYIPHLHKFIKWFADNDVAHRN